MALGTPCVSTDVTGIPEVVRHNHTGLIIAQRSPAALAEALYQLLTNSTERVRLAAEARRLIEAEFDVHKNAGRIRALWQDTKT
jgi:glycosyltransferase involved in cell wall biosynthesis